MKLLELLTNVIPNHDYLTNDNKGPLITVQAHYAEMRIFLRTMKTTTVLKENNNLSILVNHCRSFNICNSLVTTKKERGKQTW
jgi:hypothetical protein